MAKLVFAMNVSLDGYVDHDHPAFVPDPALFHHFCGEVRNLAGSIYGRRMYEVMRYWDQDQPDWDNDNGDFAHAWRRQHKWVVSRTLHSVGPNASLIQGDIAADVAKLKAGLAGEIEVGGPELAHHLSGLIDEYRLYFRPVVLGHGKPFFAGPRPPLRLVAHDRIGKDAVRLIYVPA